MHLIFCTFPKEWCFCCISGDNQKVFKRFTDLDTDLRNNLKKEPKPKKSLFFASLKRLPIQQYTTEAHGTNALFGPSALLHLKLSMYSMQRLRKIDLAPIHTFWGILDWVGSSSTSTKPQVWGFRPGFTHPWVCGL